MGHTLLMGRRTFESIGRALPGRRTIVVSRDPNYQAQGCEMAGDIHSGILFVRQVDELFICGGAEIFRQTLPLADRIYLTELESEMEGDTFFPELPSGEFQTIQIQQFKDKLNYQFSILQRRWRRKKS
jgi:dihydrofolate reductase